MTLRDILKKALKNDFRHTYGFVIDIILAIPITETCKECGGRGYKTVSLNPNLNPNTFPAIECRRIPCPLCMDGQRVIMKVKTCKAYVKNSPCKEDCETNGFSAYSECKITEPLTLADIDWNATIKEGKLTLHDNWEVESE